jgi:hypothetical protein
MGPYRLAYGSRGCDREEANEKDSDELCNPSHDSSGQRLGITAQGINTRGWVVD